MAQPAAPGLQTCAACHRTRHEIRARPSRHATWNRRSAHEICEAAASTHACNIAQSYSQCFFTVSRQSALYHNNKRMGQSVGKLQHSRLFSLSSYHGLCVIVCAILFSNPHPNIVFIIDFRDGEMGDARGGKRQREKHRCERDQLVASHMRPDQGSSPQPRHMP